jgi:hypothetical protein
MQVILESPEQWEALRRQIADHGVCLVGGSAEGVRVQEEIELVFDLYGVAVADIRARLVQVLPGEQLVIGVEGSDRDRIAASLRRSGQHDAIRDPSQSGSPNDTLPSGRFVARMHPDFTPAARPTPSTSRPTLDRAHLRVTPGAPVAPVATPSALAAVASSAPTTQRGASSTPVAPTPTIERAVATPGAMPAVSRLPPAADATPFPRQDQAPDSVPDDGDAPTMPVPRQGDPNEPVWKRYETMTRAEKIHLAKYGGADERRVVLRDRDTSLHAMVLANPGLGAQEIAALFRAGQVSGQFVQRVAERRDLTQNPVVAEALVFHPATPIDLAEKLVALLPVDVVRRIAKKGDLRMQIVVAARRRAVN